MSCTAVGSENEISLGLTRTTEPYLTWASCILSDFRPWKLPIRLHSRDMRASGGPGMSRSGWKKRLYRHETRILRMARPLSARPVVEKCEVEMLSSMISGTVRKGWNVNF